MLAKALGMPGPIYLGEFARVKGFAETETEYARAAEIGTGAKGGSQGPIGGFLSPIPWAQTTGGVEPGFATRT